MKVKSTDILLIPMELFVRNLQKLSTHPLATLADILTKSGLVSVACAVVGVGV